MPDGTRLDEAAAHGSGEVTRVSGGEAPADESADDSANDSADDSTGDIVIDSALQDLRDAPADDLDAQIEAGQRVQQTLQARLGDLGGE